MTTSPATHGTNARTRALLIVTYALLAAALAALVAVLWSPGGAPPVLALPCALAAFCAERWSVRARQPLAVNAAPACYVLATLLFPAPWAVLIAAAAVIASSLSLIALFFQVADHAAFPPSLVQIDSATGGIRRHVRLPRKA